MKFWTIDDGAIHTVVANDEAEALGLYVESLMKSGCDWPTEKPAVSIMGLSEEYALHPSGGTLSVKLPVHEWIVLYGKPQYVGCSEF